MPDIICLGGPTGCGKTALAIVIGKELDCEIINADSRQLYADFPIVTAQPDRAEMRELPHHLYGILETGERMNAGQWRKLALEKIRQVHARGHIPLLVGGTGFYFQALLHGLAPIPDIDPAISERIIKRLLEEGAAALHSELAAVDPDFAASIHPNDRQRTQRGLEVYQGTGKPLSSWHRSHPPANPFYGRLYILEPKLSDLAVFLNSRIDKMIEAGALEEVERALGKCPDRAAPGWSGIGCHELRAFIEGKSGWAESLGAWRANTRTYAKRQLTWFRGRKDTVALTRKTVREVIELVRTHLHP